MEYAVTDGMGRKREAGCQKVVTGYGIIGGVAEAIREYYSAGRIAVCYIEDVAPIADKAIKAFEDGGYYIKRLVYPIGIECDEASVAEIKTLAEEYRFVVAVGSGTIGDIAKLCERDYALVLTAPSTDSVAYSYARGKEQNYSKAMGRAPKAIIADYQEIATAKIDSIAAGYGEIISRYAGLSDYQFRAAYRYASQDGEVYAKIVRLIDEFIGAGYTRTSPRLVESITDTILQLGLYTDMMEDGTITDCVAVAAMALQGEKAIATGALEAICAVGALDMTTVLLDNRAELIYPPCKIAMSKVLEKMTGIPCVKLAAAMANTLPEEMITRDYVLSEYAGDIKAFYLSRKETILRAVKSWRRLYDDAGRNLAGIIKADELIRALSATSLLNESYTILRHLTEIGAA